MAFAAPRPLADAENQDDDARNKELPRRTRDSPASCANALPVADVAPAPPARVEDAPKSSSSFLKFSRTNHRVSVAKPNEPEEALRDGDAVVGRLRVSTCSRALRPSSRTRPCWLRRSLSKHSRPRRSPQPLPPLRRSRARHRHRKAQIPCPLRLRTDIREEIPWLG